MLKTPIERALEDLISSMEKVLEQSDDMKDIISAIQRYSHEEAMYQEYKEIFRDGKYDEEILKAWIECLCRREAILHIIHRMQREQKERRRGGRDGA